MARKSRKHPKINQEMRIFRNTVGYIRLSVPDKDPSGSIENQKHTIEDWSHQHQIPISHYYVNNGFSGSRFNRPAFQQMLKDIEAGKIECVVVKDLSRLGRDYITVGRYLQLFFPSQKVRFVSVNDQFDTVDGMTNQEPSALVHS